MAAVALSGREPAAALRAAVARRAAYLSEQSGTSPRLVVVSAGSNSAGVSYSRSLARTAASVGVDFDVLELDAGTGLVELQRILGALNERDDVAGVLLQTPLPAGVEYAAAAAGIDPGKDVDGANPLSLGRLACAQPTYAPATAEAVVRLLDAHRISLPGADVVIVGRSQVVGLPLALLLMARRATVTTCDLNTRDMARHTVAADIVVAAAGRAALITPAHVNDQATVVDVGVNATADGALVGDVDPSVATVAAALSPVPGGVGPLTTAVLFAHVVGERTNSSQFAGTFGESGNQP